MAGLMEKIIPEIVRKIREAPNDEDALKIYELTQDLRYELGKELGFVKREVMETLLNELKISGELRKEIMRPFEPVEH